MTGAAHDAELAPIREAVRALCAEFPGEYWRKLDRERAYPTEFVAALTKAGFLAALIPEEYGGSGLPMSAAAAIMEEIHAAGCNGAACHAQMYTMGTVLRHGSAEQKQKYLPGIAKGELRLQAFGVTEPTSGTDTLSLRTTAVREGNSGYVVNGQKIWTSRAEHSDLMLLLARTTPREQAKKRTEGLSVFLVDMRAVKGKGLTIRPIRTMMNHATTEVFFDNMQVPAENLIGEEGKGFRYILSGMNAERILIALGVHRRRQVVHREGDRLRQGARAVRPADRPEPGRAVPDRALLHADARRRADGARGGARCYEAGEDCGEEANMAKQLAAEASWAAADMCLQTHGGFGFAEEFDIERKFRETRLYTVAPISTNLVLSYSPSTCSACRGRTDCGDQLHAAVRLEWPLPRSLSLEQAVARADVLVPPRRRRRARHQDRAAGGRFRARLRRAGERRSAAISSGSTAARNRVVLDLAKAEDKALLEAMLAKADVFIQNLKPGAVAKLGFAVERLRARLSAADRLLGVGLRRERPLRRSARPTTC